MTYPKFAYALTALRLRFRLLGLTTLIALLFLSNYSYARFVIDDGKGKELCEKVTVHINRLTEDGKAKRLWASWLPQAKPNLMYPQSQSYLTRELLSFPDFKRPAFTEIKLQDIKPLIELMGEVDNLGTYTLPDYSNSEGDISRYLADRKAGVVPNEVFKKLKPLGKHIYSELARGKARVYMLKGLNFVPQTLLQIEYKQWQDHEPVSMLRHVSNDLKEPRPHESGLDSLYPRHALVLWHGKYFMVSSAGVTLSPSEWLFELDLVTHNPNFIPYRCRAVNDYYPQ